MHNRKKCGCQSELILRSFLEHMTCPALPCLALPYPDLPCTALPCPTPPHSTQPHPYLVLTCLKDLV